MTTTTDRAEDLFHEIMECIMAAKNDGLDNTSIIGVVTYVQHATVSVTMTIHKHSIPPNIQDQNAKGN